jgi:hypothetical protein
VSDWKPPEPITDTQYRAQLIELLGVEDPADPLRSASIEHLEAVVLENQLTLPIVRRIVPASEEPALTWGQTDRGIEFFNEPNTE